MPPLIAFIGWHNSGKTTLARQVVSHLRARGHTVAVIKSTKESGIVFDRPGSDTSRYKEAGAEGVALVAPDQLIVRRQPLTCDLPELAERLFPEADIVLAEGFKHAEVLKIEVRRDAQAPLLRDLVAGVIAVASDPPLAGEHCFRLDQSREIAELIECRLLTSRPCS
ncbi:molybdopterin-guanine dinucleotide biosynthesis protein B [Desulfobulbus sp.]|uniref:molybdopterin-guanine dinucleotide biosynthesis protein B n=1 Tax=Desulfobulbus sp. TaxID=895 RepID=UPI00286EFA55|nr:molybdopterin-guanine dinucleotide biosynthesis protein B [Desulfobulbus sp.]